MTKTILAVAVLIVAVACGSAGTLAPTATLVPTEVTLSGTGNQATELFTLRPGLARFDMTHNGESNFIVYLLDEHGDRVGLIANSVGAGDYSKAVKIETAGKYLLNVTADGAWTITATQ